ncbi:hypothetical protein JD844_033966, partial [Phrynosoma platyrhinos]
MGNFPMRFPGFPVSSGSTNPFANFPGGSPNTGVLSPRGAPAVPNTYGQPPLWPRPGQPNSGSQGTVGHAEQTRLQEQKKNPLELKALHLQIKLDQSNREREIQDFQEKIKKAEKEKNDCQLEKLQVQTREEKYRALETKVMMELEPARQKLATEVDRVLAPKQLAGCYHSEITNMRDVCLNLASNLQSQLSTFARQVDQKVNEVAQENGRLQGQRESCAHALQERERQLGAQKQQLETEKQVLLEMQATEKKKMEAEQQKLAREKEELKGQLEQSKQACLQAR